MPDKSSAMVQPYEIVSVRRAEPPPGAEGSKWHHYVIAFEGNVSIHGYRQGNLDAVTMAVEDIVAQLNARQLKQSGKRGRVDLVWPPKKKPRNM